MLLNCGVGEDSWESLGLPINPQGNQSWLFFGRTDVEAETPILWPPDVKNWLIGKDPDAGKDWRQGEKGMTEDEMVGCHHRWIWVWVSSRSWWWTGNPGMLQSMGSQIVRYNWATWTELTKDLEPKATEKIKLVKCLTQPKYWRNRTFLSLSHPWK